MVSFRLEAPRGLCYNNVIKRFLVVKFNFKNEMDIESNLNCIDNMKAEYLFKVNFKDGKYKTAKEISKITNSNENTVKTSANSS